jgi:hypothetical protein
VLLAKWIPEAIEYEIELDHNITSLSAYIIYNSRSRIFIPEPRNKSSAHESH